MKRTLFWLLLLVNSITSYAQYTKLTGFEGGNVRKYVYDGTTLYAQNGATSNNPLYKSTNLGATWQNISPGIRLYPYQLCKLNKIGNKLFIGPAMSSNNGASWTINNLIPMNQEKSISSNGVYYALQWMTGERKIFRSLDTLKTASILSNATVPVDTNFNFQNLFATTNGAALYTKHGLFHTVNAGNSWQQISLPGPVSAYQTTPFMKVSGSDIYCTSTLNDSVYVSQNLGATWKTIYYPAPFLVDVIRGAGTRYYICQGTMPLLTADVAVSPATTTLTGNFSALIGNSIMYNFFQDMLYINNSTLLLTTENMGVVKYDPSNNTYTKMNNGFANAGITAIGGNDTVTLAFKKDENYEKSYDKGITWLTETAAANFIHHNRSLPVTTVLNYNNKLYVGAVGDERAFVSSDNAQSWKRITTGLDVTVAGLYPGILTMTPHQSTLYAGANNGFVYKMITDTSWVMVGGPSPARNAVTSLVSLNNFLFASTDQKPGSSLGSVYRSADNGQTWTLSAGGINFSNVLSLGAVAGKLIAGCGSKGMYRSNDNGATWQQCVNGLPPAQGFAVSTIQYLQTVGNKIYGIQTASAVLDSMYKLYSYDVVQDKWTCESCSQPYLDLTSFWVTDSTIYVGTDGDGVWKKTVGSTTHVGTSLFQSESDAIQLYPNPSAAPVLTTSRKLVAGTITVTDQAGRTVLIQETTGSTHQLRTNDLPGGIYFIHVSDQGSVIGLKKWIKQ